MQNTKPGFLRRILPFEAQHPTGLLRTVKSPARAHCRSRAEVYCKRRVPMAKPPEPPLEEEVPLYIRWGPDRSPYSIELRLGLVSKIAAEVNLSEQLGSEIGGFLQGALLPAQPPTIRIDDVEMLSNGSDDDTVFLPEPGELQRLSALRGRARRRDSNVVGFFRTHLRSGPMQPSLADRSILAEEFKGTAYD